MAATDVFSISAPGQATRAGLKSGQDYMKGLEDIRASKDRRKIEKDKNKRDADKAKADEKRAQEDEKRKVSKETRDQEAHELAQKSGGAQADVTVAQAEEFLGADATSLRQQGRQNAAMTLDVEKVALSAQTKFAEENPNAAVEALEGEHWVKMAEMTAKADDATNKQALDLIERAIAGMIDIDQFNKEFGPLYEGDVAPGSIEELQQGAPMMTAALTNTRDHLQAKELENIKQQGDIDAARIRATASNGTGGLKASDYSSATDLPKLAATAMPILQSIAPVLGDDDDDVLVRASNDVGVRAQGEWDGMWQQYVASGKDPSKAPPPLSQLVQKHSKDVVGRVAMDGKYYTEDPSSSAALVQNTNPNSLNEIDKSKKKWIEAKKNNNQFMTEVQRAGMTFDDFTRVLDGLWKNSVERADQIGR